MKAANMSRLFVINEFSVFRLLFSTAKVPVAQILDIDPILPYMGTILRRIVSRMVARDRAKWAIDGFDDLKRVRDAPGKILLYNVLGEIEPWQNKYFGFSRYDQSIGDYGMAAKHVITNYIGEKHISLLVLRRLFGATELHETPKCIGMHRATQSAAEYYCGQPLPGDTMRVPARLLNLALAGLVLISSLKWVAFHLRFRSARKQPIFCAADFIGDERDCRLYKELEDGGPMLMVSRGWGRNSPLAANLQDYEFCERGDGHIGFGDIFAALRMIFSDQWHLYRYFGAFFPGIYWRIAKLPYQRLMYRGLFSRYAVQYFWGRDPYNAEHIIRRQEINRAGGKSFGVNTGYLTWSILITPWRYISFDRFYVFGRGKYQEFYGDTWAKDMNVIPAGSFTARRRHYAHRFDHRAPDIAIFTSVFIGEPQLMDFVRALAATFTDRKIILQTKENFDNIPGQQEFINGCKRGLPNVEYSVDSVYDIFMKVRYSFSDPSSVVAEALQFGVISFGFDMPELQVENVNRKYPGLTVTDAAEAALRIRAIEAGEQHYPIEEFRDVVDMSGMVFFDRIRKDMGLSPREQSISLLGNGKTELATEISVPNAQQS